MKKLFISYSHSDGELLDRLHQHLSALKRQKLIECWTDRDIDAGGRVHDEIKEQLEAANIILLLISPAFLASDYCIEKEMARALEKETLGLARVIPIILRPVDWNIPELRNLLALPKDGKPVISSHWHSTDEAFANVVEALRRILVSSAPAKHTVKESVHDGKAEGDQSFTKLGSEIELEKQRVSLLFSREGADMVRKAQDELFDHILQRANRIAASAPELHLDVKRGEMPCFPNDKIWLNVQGAEGITLRIDGTRPDRAAVSIARCEIAVAKMPLDRYSEEKARKLEEWTFTPEFSASTKVSWKGASCVTLSNSQLADFAFKHFHSHLEERFNARRS